MVTCCIEKDRVSTSGASFGMSVVWSCIGAHGYPIHIGGGGSWRNGALLGMFVVWSHMEGICRAHSQSNGVLVGYGDNSIATVIYCNRASGL